MYYIIFSSNFVHTNTTLTDIYMHTCIHMYVYIRMWAWKHRNIWPNGIFSSYYSNTVLNIQIVNSTKQDIILIILLWYVTPSLHCYRDVIYHMSDRGVLVTTSQSFDYIKNNCVVHGRNGCCCPRTVGISCVNLYKPIEIIWRYAITHSVTMADK